MEKSNFGKLNIRDAIKATLLAGISAGITVLYTGIQSGNVDFKVAGTTAAIAALGYLVKNVFEGEK